MFQEKLFIEEFKGLFNQLLQQNSMNETAHGSTAILIKLSI